MEVILRASSDTRRKTEKKSEAKVDGKEAKVLGREKERNLPREKKINYSSEVPDHHWRIYGRKKLIQ